MLKRLLTVTAILLLLPATAEAKLRCSSGKTALQAGKTRIFQSKRRGPWYLCSARLRRPHEFFSVNEDASEVPSEFRLFGRRVGFAVAWEDGVEAGWDAGWVDVNTGEVREFEIEPDTVVPGDETQAVAVDADGSVAFIQDNSPEGQVIGWALNGIRRFDGPEVLTTIAAGDVVPGSLAFDNGVVSWTTTAGVAGSMPTPS